jgi:hypothetical protein
MVVGGGTALNVPKLETGSYAGTGTYGSDKPSSITFEGTPILVVISAVGKTTDAGIYFTQSLTGTYSTVKNVYSETNTGSAKLDGNTLSWYDSDRTRQHNNWNTTYNYFALTI